MSASQRIDDRDGSVVYSTPAQGFHWTTHGGPNEFMGTTSLTRTGGASAMITFTGSSIAVYGTISPTSIASSGPTSQYSLNGGPPTTYTTRPLTDVQYNILFYQSPPLDTGQHTLQIVNESEGGWFWLDYLIVTTAAALSPDPTTLTTGGVVATVTITQQTNATSSVQSAPSITSLINTTSPGQSSTTGALANSTPGSNPDHSPTSGPSITNSPNADQSSGPPTGTIIGGVLGGVFGIAAILFIAWWIFKKRADRIRVTDSSTATATIPSNSALTPSPPSGRFLSNHRMSGPQIVTPFDLSGTPSRRDTVQGRILDASQHEKSASVDAAVTSAGSQRRSSSARYGHIAHQKYEVPTAELMSHTRDADESSTGLTRLGPGYLERHPMDGGGSLDTRARTDSTDVDEAVLDGLGWNSEQPRSGFSELVPASLRYQIHQPSTTYDLDSPPAYPGPPPGMSVADTS